VRYYFSKVLALGFDAAVGVVTQNLRDEGFGIITEVDAQRQDRRGVSPLSHSWRVQSFPCSGSAELEDKVAMLPCNVIIQEFAPGKVEVAALDPVDVGN